MSIIGSNVLAGASGQAGAEAYQIEQSLRFNSGDSANLSRTPSSTGNRKTFTVSCWVKRAQIGATQMIWSAGPASGGNIYLYFTSSDELQLSVDTEASGIVKTTQKFRDASAWYHIVCAVDTSQATAANRVKFFINGDAVSSFASASYPSQNHDTHWNHTSGHRIGQRNDGTAFYLNGYIAEFYNLDGTAVSNAEDFAEADDNGVWRPIETSGLTYGTNGFYLNFSNSSSLGEDQAGSNDWTANNFTTSGDGTDVMSDTPTTNYCTLNPIGTTYGFQTPTDGNLKTDANAYSKSTEGTFGIPKDGNLYYFEGTMTRDVGDGGTGLFFGCHTQGTTADLNSSSGKYFGTYGTDGANYDGAQFFRQYGNQIGNAKYGHIDADTVLAHAIKYDSGTWKYWYRQGSNGWHYWDGSSWVYNTSFDETEPTGSSSSVPESETLVPVGNNIIFNFGQRAFEYTPPTGAKYLRSSDLPEPEIADGSDYFEALTYTGANNGSSTPRNLDEVGWKPDLVWIKNRGSSTYNHVLFDAVRGVNKSLTSNNNAGETDSSAAGYLSEFRSEGFALKKGSLSGSAGSGNVDKLNDTYVAWNWLAGNSTSTPSGGTISSTVSVSPTAGFSIGTFTGTGAAGSIAHGLGLAPKFILIKRTNVSGNSWAVYHDSLGAGKQILLNSTNKASDDSNGFPSAPTSSVINVGTGSQMDTNQSGAHVFYAWAEVEGYSKFGSYTGNGNANGPFVYCGFKPALIITRRTDSGTDWKMWDDARGSYNQNNNHLAPNSSGTEQTDLGVDFLSNGFKLRTSGSSPNASGGNYIFMAWASSPFGGDGVSPASAR